MASSSRPGSSSEGAAGVPPPGALFEDPERVKLINKIADGLNTLKSELDTIKKFKTSYACLWLADMEKLRFLVDRHLPDDGLYEPFELYDKLCRIETKGRIGQKWQQDSQPDSRAPSAPQTPIKEAPPLFPSSSPPGPGDSTSGPPSSTPQRQGPPLSVQTAGSSDTSRKRPGEPLGTPKAAKKPKIHEDFGDIERDKACILTKYNKYICQSCHLYPYCLNNEKTKDVERLFQALRDFWSDERVNKWHDAIYGDASKTAKIENFILLSLNAHQLHTRALFALEPVAKDGDGKWLKLRFWWLKKHDHQGGVTFTVPPQLPPDFRPKEYAVGLHNVFNDHALVSGEEIMLETHDPETHPLPDTRLLEMQWIMNRVIAIRGSAEPKDLADDESDADSDGGLDYFARPVLQSPSLPG
ncbi:hypothetical protein IFM51744_04711 [Aspergillus udagawae]|nr:hypothetical protein IFM51744_04711 [Aspergillus udagawae]